MSFLKGLRCRECSREYPKEALYVCEYCFGSLEAVYDYNGMKGQVTRASIQSGPKSLWRYRALLPIDGDPTAGSYSGYTPLVKAENLAKELGVKELYVKDDSVCHPTCSFKDRVVAVALSRARELGFDTVACASTGNLANSVAANAAWAGFKRFIFIPANLEKAKIVGSLVYSPNLVAVDGNYDDVNRLCAEIAAKYKWGFVNINLRAYYAEGSKTMGYEIMEQLGWKTPDHIVVPAASGSLLTKIWKSMKEFEKIGLLDNEVKTKVHCAQPEGCSPIATAIQTSAEVIKPVKPKTIAKSLAIGNPADGYYAKDVVQQQAGYAAIVSDDEIREGIKLLARTEGIFTETAGGVTVASAKKLIEEGKIPKQESIVLAITGNGMKTQEAIQSAVGEPMMIDPSLASLKKQPLRKAQILLRNLVNKNQWVAARALMLFFILFWVRISFVQAVEGEVEMAREEEGFVVAKDHYLDIAKDRRVNKVGSNVVRLEGSGKYVERRVNNLEERLAILEAQVYELKDQVQALEEEKEKQNKNKPMVF